MEEAYRNPGTLIKLARIEAGFNKQKDLSSATGIPAPSISLIENNRRPPSANQIAKLVEVLPTLTADELYGSIEAHRHLYPRVQPAPKEVEAGDVVLSILNYPDLDSEGKRLLIELFSYLDEKANPEKYKGHRLVTDRHGVVKIVRDGGEDVG